MKNIQLKVMRLAGVAALSVFGMATGVQAGTIVSAVSGTINSGGPGFGTLTETINQAGLNTGYVSGVTDFDTYIASGPTHTLSFGGFEWFSNSGTTSATVTYDLGSVMTIDAFALWNEESSGIGSLDLLTSTDGVTFTSLLSDLTPTDHPLAAYLADVFAFSATSMRYMRLDMSGCPQPNVGSFPACAIGEVAWRTGTGVTVPEPTTLSLAFAALLAVGATRKRVAKPGLQVSHPA